MSPVARAFFIAAFITIAVGAQQDTNVPPLDLQTQEVSIGIQSEEERIQFLLDVASAYLSENDPSSAISAYERILEIDPIHAEARFTCSTVYIGDKQYAKAERLLRDLIEEYPEEFIARNNLAWLYATAEDPAFRDAEKAVELAQEAMIIAPNVHNVWSTLAEAYYSAGQYEKANRAMVHMSFLATRYEPNMTQAMIENYRGQMRKYKRSMDAEKVLQAVEEEAASTTLSVGEDTQE